MILPVLGTGYLNAQKLSKNDAFDILTKWEGKWKNSAVFEKSVWTQERIQTRGITETNLVLKIFRPLRLLGWKTGFEPATS